MTDIPLVLIFSVPLAAIILGIIAVLLHHRRQMELIERGMIPEEPENSSGDIWWILAVGLVLTGVGAGRMVESYLLSEPVDSIPILFIGLASIAYFTVKKLYLRRQSTE
jgi:hypothetical protein